MTTQRKKKQHLKHTSLWNELKWYDLVQFEFTVAAMDYFSMLIIPLIKWLDKTVPSLWKRGPVKQVQLW